MLVNRSLQLITRIRLIGIRSFHSTNTNVQISEKTKKFLKSENTPVFNNKTFEFFSSIKQSNSTILNHSNFKNQLIGHNNQQQQQQQQFKSMSTTASVNEKKSELASKILKFWFGEDKNQMRQIWFRSNPAFDEEIRSQFLDSLEKASRGELNDMAETPEGALALIILLDQFPRNLFRGKKKKPK